MNNLYGKAMSKYLPYEAFKQFKVNNEVVNRISNKSNNSLHGYFLEVDLEIPEELPDKYDYLPMTPEKINVTEETLSPIQLEIKKEDGVEVGKISK